MKDLFGQNEEKFLDLLKKTNTPYEIVERDRSESETSGSSKSSESADRSDPESYFGKDNV